MKKINLILILFVSNIYPDAKQDFCQSQSISDTNRCNQSYQKYKSCLGTHSPKDNISCNGTQSEATYDDLCKSYITDITDGGTIEDAMASLCM